MRLLFILTISLIASINLSGQKAEDVVKWTATLDRAEGIIVFEAEILDGWMTYSQHTDPEGPIPLEFEFETVSGAVLSGNVVENTVPTKTYSEMFEVDVLKFKKYAKFIQKVELSDGPVEIQGVVSFMACDSQKCLPPTSVPFTLN